jgi:Fic family protein
MNKSPGDYRRVANWIGAPGCSREEARFVPVDAGKLPDAMGSWERFIQADSQDGLVHLALLHAEFEALHPFLDGNGRMGRMFVPLFLWQRGLIGRPVFYISAYFESRRGAYYERLLAVSRDGDWTGWCAFFLEAVRAQAEENLAQVRAIRELYEDLKDRLPKMTHSQYAIQALDWLFEHPIFPSSRFRTSAGISKATARRFLSVLREGGILTEIRPGRGRRPAILAFLDLLHIAGGKGVG